MRDQFKHNNLDPKTLKQFIKLVKTVDDSPTLIQRIAENQEFIFCCATIINQDGDIRFNFFNQEIKKEASRQHISYEKIINKLIPIATALGIKASNSDSIQTDYYQLLGISPKSSGAVIKKAYRVKARETHPDTQVGEKDKFVSILEAYNVLSDETLRHQYDLTRKKASSWSWSEKNDEELPDKTKSILSDNYMFSFIVIILVLVTVSLVVDRMNHELSFNSDEFNVSVKKNLPTTTDLKDLKNNKIAVSEQPKIKQNESIMVLSNDTQKQESMAQIEDAGQIEKIESIDFSGPEQPRTIDKDEFIGKNKSAQLTIVPKVNKRISQLNKKREKPEQKQTNVSTDIETADDENQKAIVPISKDSEIKVRNEMKSSVESPALFAREKTSQPETSGNIVDHINLFLNHYSKSYESEDLDEFMKLFTDNAKENGKPIKSLLPLYKRNFELLDSIKYTIELKKYALDLALDKIQIKGNFHLSWQKKNETETHFHQGTIKLVLVHHAENSFQVENLTYKFAE